MAKPLYKRKLDGPHNLIGDLLTLSGVFFVCGMMGRFE